MRECALVSQTSSIIVSSKVVIKSEAIAGISAGMEPSFKAMPVKIGRLLNV
ncbi:hypothetical protein OROHE_027351 [Orobanche hederae]